MKSVKTFIIVLVLGLAGIVYAASDSRASSQSCVVNEADCCLVGASCCDGRACCLTHEAK